ncbi:hypothetical protein Tco_1466925 [Tanacetum coccineum]
MGETLVLNRSLDPFFEDYIELNDLNVPLELRRDQVNDLMPTVEEGETIEEFRAMNDARMVSRIFGYPSDCDHNKKIRIDYAYNLKFSCMIDFAILEDMDAYRDEGMGDVIFGEPFLKEVGINAKQFEGMITIHNGRYGVSMPGLTKDHKGNKINTLYPGKKIRHIQAIREYNILEDIKRDPYSKKPPIRMPRSGTSDVKTDNVSDIMVCSGSMTSIADLDVNSRNVMMEVKVYQVPESMKGNLKLRLRSKGSPREVVISSCLLGESKLSDYLFQPDSERSLSNEH